VERGEGRMVWGGWEGVGSQHGTSGRDKRWSVRGRREERNGTEKGFPKVLRSAVGAGNLCELECASKTHAPGPRNVGRGGTRVGVAGPKVRHTEESVGMKIARRGGVNSSEKKRLGRH